MDWKIKRKTRAVRNAIIRAKNTPDKSSTTLLQKRVKEANEYLKKIGVR